MALLFGAGSPDGDLTLVQIRAGLFAALEKLDASGLRRRVLAVPPDVTRIHSQSGLLTELAYEYYGERLIDVLPALGTHKAMTDAEIAAMFGTTPKTLFRVHDWRNDIVTLGEVPGEFIADVSEGKLDYSWPAQVNKLLRDGGHDLILSIGQVVPHEVVGMANGAKNIFIGTGGVMGIHRSHFLGAVYGMERMMGRVDTPVRRVLNYASEHFGKALPQIVYVQTVVSKNAAGRLVVRGLFISDGNAAFESAAALSLQCNFLMMDREIRKAVVYLDPHEFRSTWLGNKSVYRTRMALADGAELIVLAPGVREFGEDAAIDGLIRRFGYCGTPATLAAVKQDADLAANLSAAAHLIHGSSEGRFAIRYCPGHLTRQEIESVHYEYGDLAEYTAKYDPAKLADGWNTVDGEEIFFISNPGLGLWAYQGRFGSPIVVLMGVSGSGKTTIGTALAAQAGVEFVDGDDFHSAANKRKMAAGIPLTDEDRKPWLQVLNEVLVGWWKAGQGGVLACSALKADYREMLAAGVPAGTIHFVLLEAPRELLAARLATRSHDFMNPKLLDSQLATLEVSDEGLSIVNDRAPEMIAAQILKRVGVEEMGRQDGA